MIYITNGSLSYGDQTLFDEINLACAQNQRIGVLGRNGTGKSTLLKIIAGHQKFDDGAVSIEGNKKIGYMPQEVILLSEKTVLEEALSVFDAILLIDKEMKELESQLENDETGDLLERYSELCEKSSAYDQAQSKEKTERILTGLGFKRAMFDQPVATLSVGWKMRLVLAKLLLEDADFYLFDEPTNHLDLPTKEWFFDFLKEGRFGFLLVSHDRHYLDHACDYILSISYAKTKLFRGNFTQFAAEEERQRTALEAAYERQQKEITKKEELINRFRAQATKAKMAQSLIKQLDKIERIELEPLLPTVTLSFPQCQRAGQVVLTLKDIEHAFDGKKLFHKVSGYMQRGERIALVAPNGTGKTTLFNLITGAHHLQHGSVSQGHNVKCAVFEQDQLKALNQNNTVIEELLDAVSDIPESTIRTFLGSFLFSGDTIHKKIAVLSGGERNRVAMVKVLLQKANVLLLDEPTNHLDLYAKEVLLQALKLYDGTMLFVSHDHTFLEGLATRIWELTPDGLHDFPGTYESYLAHKKGLQQHNSKNDAQGNSSDQPGNIQTAALKTLDDRKQILALERKIEQTEKQLIRINESFYEIEYGSKEYKTATQKLKTTQLQLKELLEQWEVATS